MKNIRPINREKKSRRYLQVLIHVPFLALLLLYSYPLLSADLQTGWDTAGHLYLNTNFIQHILEEKIYRFDTNWLAGFPGLSLYNPGFAILHTAIHFILLTKTSIITSFNISIVFTIILFYLSIQYAFSTFLERKSWQQTLLSAVLGSFAIFFFPIMKHYGGTLAGTLQIGLIPQALGMSFLLLSTALTYKTLLVSSAHNASIFKKIKTHRYVFLAILATIATMMSHVLTSFFGIVIWIVFIFIFRKQKRKVILLILIPLIAGLLSLWWIIPFMELLPYASGNEISIIQHYNFIVFLLDPIFSISSILKIPFLHIGLLLILTFGIARYLKKRTLPTRQQQIISYLIVASIIIFGLNIAPTYLNVPIHYYRLWPIIVLFILIKAVQIIQSSFSEKTQKRIALIAVILFILHICSQYTHPLIKPAKETQEYQDYLAIQEYLQNEIQNNNEQPIRIYVENIPTGLKSTHLSHYVFANTQIENITGLLVESTMSSSLAMQSLSRISEGLTWGRGTISNNLSFIKLPDAAHLRHFLDFKPNYIIAHSETLKSVIQEYNEFYSENPIQQIHTHNNYDIFKTTFQTPIHLSEKPIILYQGNLKQFKRLSELTYIFEDFPYQFIYSPQNDTPEHFQPVRTITSSIIGQDEEKFLQQLNEQQTINTESTYHCTPTLLKTSQTSFEVRSCGPTILSYNYAPTLHCPYTAFITQPGFILLDLPTNETTFMISYD